MPNRRLDDVAICSLLITPFKSALQLSLKNLLGAGVEDNSSPPPQKMWSLWPFLDFLLALYIMYTVSIADRTQLKVIHAIETSEGIRAVLNKQGLLLERPKGLEKGNIFTISSFVNPRLCTRAWGSSRLPCTP